MEILGAIGFTLSQISFLLITVPELARKGETYLDCKRRVDEHLTNLRAAECRYDNWERVWQRFDTAACSLLWANQYEIIQATRQRIRALSQQIDERIESMFNRCDEPGYRQRIQAFVQTLRANDPDSGGRRRREKTLKRFEKIIFALSSDRTLGDEIDRLATDIRNIADISQHAFSQRTGVTQPSSVTLEETERLYQLLSILSPLTKRARNLFEARRAGPPLQSNISWAVELVEHDRYNNIKKWKHWDPINVSFAFHVRPWRWIYLCVEHSRDIHAGEDGPEVSPETNWQQIICGNADPPAEMTRRVLVSPRRVCRTFGSLFREGLLKREDVSRSWQPDRANLILSLTNWILLLWDTQWTTNLCSFQLSSVCDENNVELNMLDVDSQHRSFCHHPNNKLRNFGILLAELITATSIRQVAQLEEHLPIQYHKWDQGRDDWERISQTRLLQMVYRESNDSRDMSDVVEYCIDPANARTPPFEAGYILEYITKIYEP
jgi:hypothetical protein